MSQPTIHLGARIGLQDFPEPFVERLKIKCQGENPEFFAWKQLCKVKPWLRKQPSPPDTLHTWKATGGQFYVLRGMLPTLLHHFPQANLVDYTVAPPVSTPFQIQPPYSPFADQEEALTALTQPKFGNFGGIFELLSAPTGSGKTYMGFEIAARLQTTTLFLVNTDVLVKQTVEECRKILGIEPGIIKGSRFEVRDFTVGSVQTLVKRIADPSLTGLRTAFGLVIQDETHLAAATTFQQVLSFFRCRYCYGLSGTIRRGDGLQWIVFQGIGPLGFSIDDRKLVAQNRILKPTYQFVDTPYVPSCDWGGFEWTEQLTELCQDPVRNAFILQDLINFLPGKNALVLSGRTDHVDWLHTQLAKAFPHLDPIRYHGKMPTKLKNAEFDRMKANASPITVSTFQAVGTGLDVKGWEDLIVATPIKSEPMLRQAIGRIRRAAPGKSRCHIRDYRDPLDYRGQVSTKTTLASKARRRQDVYDSF